MRYSNNRIVNLGGATADDVRTIVSVGIERVWDEFGVELITDVIDLIRVPWWESSCKASQEASS